MKIKQITKSVSIVFLLVISTAFADNTLTNSVSTNTNQPQSLAQNQTNESTQSTITQTQPDAKLEQVQTIPSEAKISNFAEQAALATFSYSHKDYQTDLEKMKKYFTQSGWQSFTKALKDSNNLEVVQKELLTVTSKINGPAKVTKHDSTNGNNQWQVQIPIQVTYTNDKNQQIQQLLLVKLTILDDTKSPEGIGIEQFIAVRAPISSSVKSNSAV